MDDEKMMSEVDKELEEMKAALLARRNSEQTGDEAGHGAEDPHREKLGVNFIYVEEVDENPAGKIKSPAGSGGAAQAGARGKGTAAKSGAALPQGGGALSDAQMHRTRTEVRDFGDAEEFFTEDEQDVDDIPDEGQLQASGRSGRSAGKAQTAGTGNAAPAAEDDDQGFRRPGSIAGQMPRTKEEVVPAGKSQMNTQRKKNEVADPREEERRRKEELIQAERKVKKKSHPVRVFLRVLEVIAICTSFLSSHFMATYIFEWLDGFILIEVTARFGRETALKFNTWYAGVKASIIARPEIIAVVITGIILVINVFVWTGRGIRKAASRNKREKDKK